MSADPKDVRTEDDEELESEEMVNDSLGEVTPSDATGLDADRERERAR